MFEIAVRIRDLASSNLNSLVDSAASPAKMLKLLQLELEEAIIGLGGDATRAQRRARDCAAQADAAEKAAADWQDKARLALANDREDLARAALGEKDTSAARAAALRGDAAEAGSQEAVLRTAITDLEAKLDETRARLRAELARGESASPATGTPSAARVNARVDAVSDRISVLEKRIDFATERSPKAASLDAELAAMKREAALDDELAALKKSVKKAK